MAPDAISTYTAMYIYIYIYVYIHNLFWYMNVRVLLADPAVSLTLVKPAQRTRVVSYYMYVNQPLFLRCAMHVLHLRLPHPPLHLSVPHFETKRKSCDASSSSVPLAVSSTLSWI